MYVSVDRCGPLGHHCNDVQSLHTASGPSEVGVTRPLLSMQPRSQHSRAVCVSPNYICRHGRICYNCQPRPGVRSPDKYYDKHKVLLL